MVSEMTVEQELKIQAEIVEMVVGSVVRNAQNIGALVDKAVAVVVSAAAVIVVCAVAVTVVSAVAVIVVAAAAVVVAVVVVAADVTVEMADKKVGTGKKLSSS